MGYLRYMVMNEVMKNVNIGEYYERFKENLTELNEVNPESGLSNVFSAMAQTINEGISGDITADNGSDLVMDNTATVPESSAGFTTATWTDNVKENSMSANNVNVVLTQDQYDAAKRARIELQESSGLSDNNPTLSGTTLKNVFAKSEEALVKEVQSEETETQERSGKWIPEMQEKSEKSIPEKQTSDRAATVMADLGLSATSSVQQWDLGDSYSV